MLIIKLTPVNTVTTRPTRILAYSYVAAFISLVRLRAMLVDVYGAPVNMTPRDNYILAVYANTEHILDIGVTEVETDTPWFTRVVKFFSSELIYNDTESQ